MDYSTIVETNQCFCENGKNFLKAIDKEKSACYIINVNKNYSYLEFFREEFNYERKDCKAAE